MKFTLRELERVMVTARLIADHHGAEKTDRFKETMTVDFEEGNVATDGKDCVFFAPAGAVGWCIEADQFRRGISPLDIFNEEKKGRKR